MEIIKTLIKSTRLSWAAKNFNMYLLALSYAYFTDLIIKNPWEVLEGLILVCILWGSLYALNDLTDLELDRNDKEKRKRAFIQNHVDKKWIITFIILLISLVFFVSIVTLTPLFSVILGLMVLNQFIYTVPPIRLKDTFLGPFTSTATNTVLRLASCSLLLGSVLIVPLSVYLLMYLAGMGTYLMYKSRNRFTTIISILFGILLLYIFYVGDMNLLQFMVAVLPAFISTIPLYLSNFYEKEMMVKIADILYHKVAMVFFLICILYILFLG
ncbi:MAG: UbiA family prenyltransferase [Methanobacteriaceae archaeon]|nr:UbiA family prenyltransferase [Methanobacteriaceae archaeon]